MRWCQWINQIEIESSNCLQFSNATGIQWKNNGYFSSLWSRSMLSYMQLIRRMFQGFYGFIINWSWTSWRLACWKRGESAAQNCIHYTYWHIFHEERLLSNLLLTSWNVIYLSSNAFEATTKPKTTIQYACNDDLACFFFAFIEIIKKKGPCSVHICTTFGRLIWTLTTFSLDNLAIGQMGKKYHGTNFYLANPSLWTNNSNCRDYVFYSPAWYEQETKAEVFYFAKSIRDEIILKLL